MAMCGAGAWWEWMCGCRGSGSKCFTSRQDKGAILWWHPPGYFAIGLQIRVLYLRCAPLGREVGMWERLNGSRLTVTSLTRDDGSNWYSLSERHEAASFTPASTLHLAWRVEAVQVASSQPLYEVLTPTQTILSTPPHRVDTISTVLVHRYHSSCNSKAKYVRSSSTTAYLGGEHSRLSHLHEPYIFCNAARGPPICPRGYQLPVLVVPPEFRARFPCPPSWPWLRRLTASP